MTDITVAAGGFPHYQEATDVEIWIVANKPFVTGDGKPISASSVSEGTWMTRVTGVTIDVNKVLQAPQIVLDATEDAISGSDATLSAFVVTPQGRAISVLSIFGRFKVPATPASTTWEEIATYNAGTLPADVGHDVHITGDLIVDGEIIKGSSGGASTLLDRLVAHWKLDESSGNRLDSVGSNDLTPVSAPGSVAGKQGNAASFASASSQCLTIADNVALSMTGRSFTLACWVKVATATNFSGVLGKWQASGPAEYIICLNSTGTKFRLGLSGNSGATQNGVDSIESIAVGQWQFLVATYDNATGAFTIRVNNGTAATGTHAAGIDSTTLAFQIGAFSSAFFLDGAVDEAGIWDRVLTVDEMTALYNSGSGVTHPFTGVSGGGASETHTLAASDLHDNGYSTVLTGYTRSSQFARAVFDTEATSLSVDIYSNFTATGNNIEVRVNGAFHARLAAGSGATTVTTSLPAGNKRVEIVAGEQLKNGSTIKGVFLNAFTTNGAHTMVLPNNSNGRLLVYGDSIASGYTSSTPVSCAWPALIRQMRLASTVVEAWGDRTLYENAHTSLLRAAFVSHLVAQNPTIMWITIGVNDAGENFWNSTDFISAYAALLDDLHAALPPLKIYCQSWTISTTQEANLNSFGETFNDYRAKIQTAANARAWCQFVDGTTILVAGDIVDNVHPSDAGAAKYARFVGNVLHLQ